MDEIRKDNIVEMYFANDKLVKAFVVNYSINRVELCILDEYTEIAKQIKPLDNLILVAHTEYGIKKTYSSVISELDGLNCMIVENNPSVAVIQKREFVRVSSNVNFKIKKDNKIFNCKCLNISGNGIAFIADEAGLELNDDVRIIFPEDDFDKELIVCATINIKEENRIVAKYYNLNDYDEAKIVKYVFKNSTKKLI